MLMWLLIPTTLMMFVYLISKNIVDELVIIGYTELSIAMWRPTTVLISRSFALSALVLKNGGNGVLDCCLQRFLKVCSQHFEHKAYFLLLIVRHSLVWCHDRFV
ncbi:hypothetical protein DY000_02032527 [Brassica cretica]|uniref:Secreted protein n=1 Tax=Brassica cretica TaxID=69181 RepID=A0ABQ7DPQ1_BRACR|nr:hypothetical protein DY000_02032527 [Brassica cretica]